MKPKPEDWARYDAYMDNRRSALAAARQLGNGETKETVIRGMMRCSDWLEVSGWRRTYREMIRDGFSQADARDRADLVAANFDREHG